MFEDKSESEIQDLLRNNYEFRTLYERHRELNEQVDSHERGKLPMDELKLHALKKEKLHAKDRLAAIWAELHPAAG